MIADVDFYRTVVETYGAPAQVWMLVEECGELLNALAKYRRGRGTKEEIITELADVHIMVEQIACLFGWDAFEVEKERKLQRLHGRLAKHGAI